MWDFKTRSDDLVTAFVLVTKHLTFESHFNCYMPGLNWILRDSTEFHILLKQLQSFLFVKV